MSKVIRNAKNSVWGNSPVKGQRGGTFEDRWVGKKTRKSSGHGRKGKDLSKGKGLEVGGAAGSQTQAQGGKRGKRPTLLGNKIRNILRKRGTRCGEEK